LFGYEANAVIGLAVEDLVPVSARARHAEHRARYASAPRVRPLNSGLDLYARHQDGHEFPVEIGLSPVPGGAVIAIVRDVTDRRRAAETLTYAHEQLALVDDRERIARDLHDTAIQRLFAVGLLLQGAATRAPAGEVAERIDAAVEEIDGTIRDIRNAIFALQSPAARAPGVRDAVLQVTREAARTLGFAPHVEFEGLVDTAIGDDVAATLVTTLRDALSRLARPETSTGVDVRVQVDDDVCLVVADDRGVVLEWHAPIATSHSG
jgi:PAS domain S-box-containing protein